MKNRYKELDVEISDDMWLAERVVAGSKEGAEDVSVRTIIADARRISLDALAGIREHPIWTAGIGITTVVAGLAVGGVAAHTHRPHHS